MFSNPGKSRIHVIFIKITHPLEDHIIEKNYDKLNADYVQANNNGRWTLSAEFYNMVSPKYVFMDCSMETVNADEEEKGCGGVYRYVTGILQVPIGMYDTTPTWIILK